MDTIFTYVQQHFVSLITLLPSIIEPYQSVNTDGATVRRFTIINNDHELQAATAFEQAPTAAAASQVPSAPGAKPDARQRLPPTGAAAPSQSAALQAEADQAASSPPSGSHAGTVDSAHMQTDSHLHPTSTAAAASTAAALSSQKAAATMDSRLAYLPDSVQAAIKYMQRRYSNAVVVPNPAKDSLPRELQGTQDKQQQAVDCQDGAVCQVLLDIQPTDPSWDPKQAEKLHLAAEFTRQYPQMGSFGLRLAGKQAHLSDAACNIANQLIAAEAAQHAARNTGMQQLLRFVENRAGMLLHEAEDICLEAARRRTQNQLSAHSPAQPQSSQQLPGQLPVSHISESRQQAPPPPTTSDAGAFQTSSSNPASDMLSAGSESAHSRSATQQQNSNPQSTSPVEGLVTDLEGTHVTDGSDGEAGSRSEQDSEATWDESQWDSTASYSDDVHHDSDSEPSQASASEADDHQSASHTHTGELLYLILNSCVCSVLSLNEELWR